MLRRHGIIHLLSAALCAGALSIPALVWSGSVDFDGITADDPPVPLISHVLVGAGSRESEPIVAEQPPEGDPGAEHNGVAEDEDLIVFDPPVLDFGRVVAGSVVSKDVWIINRSSTPVTVVEARSTCGCTVARVPAQSIAPGDRIRTEVRLTVPRHAATVKKEVRFRFGMEEPDRTLTVQASAVRTVNMMPEYLQPDTLGSTSFVIESTDDRSFRILGAAPFVLAEPLSQGSATRHELRIDKILWYAAGQPFHVDLTLDHPDIATISLRVESLPPAVRDRPNTRGDYALPRVAIARAPNRLMLSADRLRLGEIATDSPAEARLTVFGDFPNDAQPLVTLESSVAEVSLQAIERDSTGMHITLRLLPKVGRTGFVRSPLLVQVGASRAICEIFAHVNGESPLGKSVVP